MNSSRENTIMKGIDITRGGEDSMKSTKPKITFESRGREMDFPDRLPL